MPETTPLIKAALNLRVGVGFDVYEYLWTNIVFPSIRGNAQTPYAVNSASVFAYESR